MNLAHFTLRTTLLFAFALFFGLLAGNAQAKPNDVQYEAFTVSVVGSGKPVLLIPGVSSSASVWNETVDLLKSEYELHVFNLAGFAGVKPAPPQKVGSSFLNYQKQSLINYIEQNKLTDVVIVGHSLGGFLSLWLATEQIENVRAVVNVDGLPALGALFTSIPADQGSQSTPQQFDPVAMVKGMANNTQWHQRILNDMTNSDQMTSGRAMGELMAMDIRPQLTNIKIPTLTIGAPAQGQPYSTYEQSVSNYESQFENLPQELRQFAFAKTAKHFIMADEPKWMNEQITLFLQSL